MDKSLGGNATKTAQMDPMKIPCQWAEEVGVEFDRAAVVRDWLDICWLALNKCLLYQLFFLISFAFPTSSMY